MLTDFHQENLSALVKHSAPSKIIASYTVSGGIMRSTHVNIPKNDALKLEVPQDALYRLYDNGHIERIAFGI